MKEMNDQEASFFRGLLLNFEMPMPTPATRYRLAPGISPNPTLPATVDFGFSPAHP